MPHWSSIVFVILGGAVFGAPLMGQGVTKFVRYHHEERTSYGVLEGENVHQLEGDLFASPRKSGRSVPLNAVRLLAPVEPSKVLAIGRNFRSHLAGRPIPSAPGVFVKLPTSVIGPGEAIVIPADAQDLHYEGELVIVIGKRAKNVTVEDALDYVFGVTAGNDVTERTWQDTDLQWARAKGADTFAPLGPAIVRGVDYGTLLIQTRVNGELKQSERAKDLIYDIPTLVSYISRYITLLPGDVIFTGTPGSTSALAPGDVVEVEVEDVGILRNPVKAATARP